MLAKETHANRSVLRCHVLAATKRMRQEDILSHQNRSADMLVALGVGFKKALAALRAQTLEREQILAEYGAAPPRATPKFSAGQSVFQWWASWMKDAESVPQQYKKKNRPSWYSAEVLAGVSFLKGHRYAGVVSDSFCYHVF